MTEREKRSRTIRRLFGQGARLIEHLDKPNCPGRCEIWMGGGSMIGSGSSYRAALADGLSFLRPDMLVRASDMTGAAR